MNDKTGIFQRLLERFKFREPVSPADQAYMLSGIRESLVSALKSVKDYGMFYGMALRIFFRARRMGVRISMAQSAVILAIISTLAALAAAGGIALAPKLINQENKTAIGPKNDNTTAESRKAETSPVKEINRQKNEIKLKYRIGIEQFDNENIEIEKSRTVTGRISARLAESLGSGSVVGIAAGKRDRNINLLLTGSVGRLGGMIMISAKIIDMEKGNVIFATSENIKSEDEINGTCDRISRNIADKIKK